MRSFFVSWAYYEFSLASGFLMLCCSSSGKHYPQSAPFFVLEMYAPCWPFHVVRCGNGDPLTNLLLWVIGRKSGGYLRLFLASVLFRIEKFWKTVENR